MKCMTRNLIITASLLYACGPGTSTDAVPSRADCNELRAHVAELRLGRSQDRRDPAELDQDRAELMASLGDSFVDSCAQQTTPTYVQCALEATSRGELTRCP
jgi:hypothetical protein